MHSGIILASLALRQTLIIIAFRISIRYFQVILGGMVVEGKEGERKGSCREMMKGRDNTSTTTILRQR